MNKLKEWWTSTIGHFEITEDKAGKILPLIVLVMLFVFLFIGVRTCEQKNNEQKTLIESLKAAKDSVHHFKDKNGELHNRVESLVLYSDQLKSTGEALGLELDSMKKVVKDLKGLLYYYKGEIKEESPFMFSMEDEVKDTATLKIDKFLRSPLTSDTKHFNYSTKYLHLEGVYNSKTDSVKGKYSYKTEFQLFVYEKRQGLFKPKLTYADIVLTDPNASLVNGKSLLITQKRKWYDSRGVHIAEGVILGGLGMYGASLIFK